MEPDVDEEKLAWDFGDFFPLFFPALLFFVCSNGFPKYQVE
jgi:hypothetical protein